MCALVAVIGAGGCSGSPPASMLPIDLVPRSEVPETVVVDGTEYAGYIEIVARLPVAGALRPNLLWVRAYPITADGVQIDRPRAQGVANIGGYFEMAPDTSGFTVTSIDMDSLIEGTTIDDLFFHVDESFQVVASFTVNNSAFGVAESVTYSGPFHVRCPPSGEDFPHDPTAGWRTVELTTGTIEVDCATGGWR